MPAMSGRLSIDFGTSNTIVAVWDEHRQEGVPVEIPGYGRDVISAQDDKPERHMSIIPSLISYGAGNQRRIGAEVLDADLAESNGTFRWMKRYICRRSPVRIRIEQSEWSHFDAGRDFLTAILDHAIPLFHEPGEEIAFTVPVEAFEHYESWLMDVAKSAGVSRVRLIDEASAAAAGYATQVQAGDIFLVFDFGGGTLDVSIVRMDESRKDARRCRVIAKAGADIGGATIDTWIYQEILRQNGRHEDDEDVRRMSRHLLKQCECAKELLSSRERARIQAVDPIDQSLIAGELTRTQFEEILDRQDGFRQIDHTIRRAFNSARERGFSEDDIKAVLMTGGSSLIPSTQKMMCRIFGKDLVRLRRPLEAVACGAASFVAGFDIDDHIQHDYAIRHVSPEKGAYDYRVIVNRGTPYPTRGPVARLTVKASYEGQSQLGLAIFEVGNASLRPGPGPVELIFDSAGAARVRPVNCEDLDRRCYFWVNELQPTFLNADPPAVKGEPRFSVEFGIDENKRLLITARDLRTRELIFRDHPVIRLT
jgi:molecular chaperone DnaK (HSP70)